MAVAEVVRLSVAPSGLMGADEEREALERVYRDMNDLVDRSSLPKYARRAIEACADLLPHHLQEHGVEVPERR